jgi:hypothetical protein
MSGITFGVLRREIGREAGFDRDPVNWTAEQTVDVWDLLRNAVNQVHRPPRLPGEIAAYQWSFLRPMLTVQLRAGVEDYDLPKDFAYLDGRLYFIAQDRAVVELQRVNEGRILERRQRTWSNSPQYYPQLFAICIKESTRVTEQIYELKIWPRPDADYTVRGRYHARIAFVPDDAMVPLGGQEHAELFRASCMDLVEQMLDDDRGRRHDQFLEQLAASIDFDRKASTPATMGYNWDPRDRRDYDLYGVPRAVSGLVTVESSLPDDDGEAESPTTSLTTQDGQTITTQDGVPIGPQP